MISRVRHAWLGPLLVPLVLAALATACDRKAKDDGAAGGSGSDSAAASVPEKVPPVAPLNGGPPPEIEAGNLDTQPPLEQAKVFESNGQLWMARLVLERKALGSDGTKPEAELLAKICQQQSDEACVDACGTKLGRKIKFDASAPPPAASSSSSARLDAAAASDARVGEPDTELSRTRDLVLKMQYESARKALEPKVLDGRASREEIRLLKSICDKQADRMCIALCDAKLK